MVPRLLGEGGWQVETHDDHFDQDTKDPELLSVLGKSGWVLLTQDSRIRFRTPERDAYLTANLRVFVIGSGNLTAQATAEILYKARSRIEKVCEGEPGPFVYSVHKDSTLHRLD
jgi:dihydrofolate reductase